MFESARLKLAAWYLLIIVAISICFSAFIYVGAVRETNRLLRAQRQRMDRPMFELEIPREPDPQLIEESRQRVLWGLVAINLIILGVSSVAGYFLAGRTLKPIQEMVDEQNRFITDASHELNTPLTALRTTIEVNLRDKKLDLSTAKKVLSENLEEVGSLQALSDELMELTQYQKPNGLPLESVILSEVVAAAVMTVKPLASRKHIPIKSVVTATSVAGNPRSLKELFVILLDNAIKYSPAKKAIAIASVEKDSKVEITIADHGNGIASEDLPHIFDRFYRADKSRTKQYAPGYGLGLSIAKRITTLHNGSIDVKSELGKGTTFTLIFPKSGS